jgi:hypothetical protein
MLNYSPSWCSGRRAGPGQRLTRLSWSLRDLRPGGWRGGPAAGRSAPAWPLHRYGMLD